MVNLFYEEPDPDRWLRFDRYPRRIIRRILRGQRQPGGQGRVFLNLCAGLDRIGIDYRVNDYNHAKKNPDQVACVIGKPHVLDKQRWRNPILFGAATFSHPIEKPDFCQRYPTIRRILVPGEWMRRMWEPYFGEMVYTWPVGIDADRWSPARAYRRFDFLIYDKVRWKHSEFDRTLIAPMRRMLQARKLSFSEIRYGFYTEDDFLAALRECRAMIFLCEHETQGIAYQQALSADVPILAWDRGGYWEDPAFFPHRVRFKSVSSVPYWDERCGVKFRDTREFDEKLNEFQQHQASGCFAPRNYILENLTLEKCARDYVGLWKEIAGIEEAA